MRCTSFIDECVQAISVATEYDTDIILVQMVRLQKLVEEIRASGLQNNSSLKGPVEMYVKVFQTRLQEYKSALPPNLQQNSEYTPLHPLFVHCSLLVSSSVTNPALLHCRNPTLPVWLSDAFSN